MVSPGWTAAPGSELLFSDLRRQQNGCPDRGAVPPCDTFYGALVLLVGGAEESACTCGVPSLRRGIRPLAQWSQERERVERETAVSSSIKIDTPSTIVVCVFRPEGPFLPANPEGLGNSNGQAVVRPDLGLAHERPFQAGTSPRSIPPGLRPSLTETALQAEKIVPAVSRGGYTRRVGGALNAIIPSENVRDKWRCGC
jgi:hypothetical protein